LRILILGGDGFCGWPTSLHLSARGHDVVIVDNLARRSADLELEAESLTPIRPLGERRAAWRELTGRDVGFARIDVAQDYDELRDLLTELRP
jgi:UDP-sulfoquinovose synthase